jgi:DNA-binding transcriptional MerR regulator
MKTVKEVSEITGVSIRTLRYYDEIGLLKPTQLTEAGYRLYDNKSLEKLQQVMFFRELEIPLTDIKKIMGNSNYDKEQALLTQKSLLENKRNRLNGIIELINDVMKGVNTMSFEAFTQADVQKMLDHTLEIMSKETLAEQVEKYGSIEKYREYLATGFNNEKAVTDIIKYYGGKEKAVEAVLQSKPNKEELEQQQNENVEIYRQLMQAKNTGNAALEKEAIAKHAELYKKMFNLDNARAMLLDLAKEYTEYEKFAEATDNQFGKGCAEYTSQAIRRYYGEL